MMSKEMYTESASVDKERMLKYKTFAAAFSYPDDSFFAFFPNLSSEKENLISEYDGLFRANEIWLYSTEYLAKNEFQRSNNLADIMGFYRAFGLEPNGDRPDSLSCEFEFMHFLIFKKVYALESEDDADAEEKAFICLDAQKKFFAEHLYPAAIKIAGAIIAKTKKEWRENVPPQTPNLEENNFYIKIAHEMLQFLESEKKLLGGDTLE
ncbi:MAG: molecular chaperone TorD family protein [Candidatus Poribacteria bacterium]